MGLAAVLAGAAGGSTLLSSIAQYQQGQYARVSSIRQSEELEQQTRQAQFIAGTKIIQDDYRASHLLSRIKATAAASGIDANEGSTELVWQSSADEARINDMYTKYAANAQASQLRFQGELLKSQGEEEAQAADLGAVTGLISGGIETAGIYKYGVNYGAGLAGTGTTIP